MTLPYRRILFPTDLSDLSFGAWPHALELAARFGAEVHAVVVLEEPYALAPYEQYGALLQAMRDVKPQVEQKLLDRVRDHPPGVVVKTAVLEAAFPTHALNDYVRRERIDAIVMATHGRSGITHLLLGSIAEKLVRSAEVPVMVVRPVTKS